MFFLPTTGLAVSINHPLSTHFSPSSIKMIGALQPKTMYHSSQPNGTIPNTDCRIGV